jgi:hypothetical protein
MADFRPTTHPKLENFLRTLRGKPYLIEPLTTRESIIKIGPVIFSLGFFEEHDLGGKRDLLDTCTHLSFYEDALLDRISVYSNMVLDNDRIDPDQGLKFLTVTVIKDTDDWIWLIADKQRVIKDSPRTAHEVVIGLSPNDIFLYGAKSWKCDQITGLLNALSSPEFRSLVVEWHGNYKVD